jgi:hypothetical protein
MAIYDIEKILRTYRRVTGEERTIAQGRSWCRTTSTVPRTAGAGELPRTGGDFVRLR